MKQPLHDKDADQAFATFAIPNQGRLHGRPFNGALLYLRRHFFRDKQSFSHLSLLGGAILLGIGSWSLVTLFFMPTTLGLSFGSTTCAFNPLLLPRLTSHHPSGNFEPVSISAITIAGYPVFSHKTCVQPKAMPTPGSSETLSLAPFGNPLLRKNIAVVVDNLPVIEAPVVTDPLNVGDDISFTINQTDTLFRYRLESNKQSSECTARNYQLVCSLLPLQLSPGDTYELALWRSFKGDDAQQVLSYSLTTLDPVTILTTSIPTGSVVYEKPNSLFIRTNKPLRSSKGVSLVRLLPEESSIETTVVTDGSLVTIQLTEELARSTSFELRIETLTAIDGSQLTEPYVARFVTSSGPQVTGVSIGGAKVDLARSIDISFDVPLSPAQNPEDKVRISAQGTTIAAQVTITGNTITVNPKATLPRCTNLTISVTAGLVSTYGVGDGGAWEFSSRTICQVAFSIGTSAQGRSIVGYRFGEGASRIVFVGGMHGNEKSSTHTLQGFIEYLELNAHKLPAGRSVIVIPNHNPDGYASSRRTNANNVDLNRNFPSNDWQTSVQMPGDLTLVNGGGSTPLDQPESAALASYIKAQRPRLVLTYHAVARVVISNDTGDSVSLGKQYAADSDYDFTSNADSGSTFDYATTGEFEDWLADKEGIPALLVELSSMSSNQFSSHKSAMWNMATLP